MNDAAVDLAFSGLRIDHFAAVVDDDVVEKFDAAGVWLDLELDRMDTKTVRQGRGLEVDRRFQAGRNAGGKFVARGAGQGVGDLEQADGEVLSRFAHDAVFDP